MLQRQKRIVITRNGPAKHQRFRRCGACHQSANPPSTSMVVPVVNLLSSDAR
jgi:hypothetical protein